MFNPVLPYYQLLVLIVGLLMVVRTVQIFRTHEVGSGFMTITIMTFVFAAVHDISYNRGGPGVGMDLVSYALLMFMLSQSVAIARRFATAYHTTDHLSQNLQAEVHEQTKQLKALLAQERQLLGQLGENNQTLTRTHDELEVALGQAQVAAEAKAAFLANMSHELRTPLNGVIGMSEILAISELNDDQQGLITTLQSSGDALLSIISDILDFSKIDTGEVELETVHFCLTDVVENVTHLLAPKAEQKGLSIGALFDDDVPTHVFGDPGRLGQILTNLVGNALKFTQQGEVIVHVELAIHGDAEVMLRFEVSDTGVGIPEAAQSRLFEAFEQAELSTTRQYGGTGLGLAISRELIHRLGGRMGVESTVGEGSTFWFELPYTPAEATPELSMTHELAGTRALVVDDNATNLRVLEGLLRRWHINVISVRSAAEAMAVIETGHPIDIALLDYQMPDVDGLTLAEQLRDTPATATLPIVLLTSISLRSCSMRAKEVGVNVRVTKPVRRQVLVAAMCKALGYQSGEGEAFWDSSHGSFPPQMGHILVVDDNAVNRDVISRLISGFGYTVKSASDGVEALRILDEYTFDAILMDCQMPVLDGYETTERIRINEAGGTPTPIIAVTAAGTQRDRDRAMTAGMNDWIHKPVRRHTLFEVLSSWVDDNAASPADIARQEAAEDAELAAVPVIEIVPPGPAHPDSLIDELVVDGLKSIGDPEFFAELLADFAEDTASELETIKGGLADGRWDDVARAAHSLKGMSANVGARALSQAAAELDAACAGDSATLGAWDTSQLSTLADASIQALAETFEVPAPS